MTQTTTDHTETLSSYGEWAHGGTPADAADEWVDEGYSAESMDEWLSAKCWEPMAARSLAAAGVTPEQAATVVPEDVGRGGYKETIGYKVSNSDLGADDAAAHLRDED